MFCVFCVIIKLNVKSMKISNLWCLVFYVYVVRCRDFKQKMKNNVFCATARAGLSQINNIL